MGAMTAIMVGLGVVSAAQQISAGYAAKDEANRNASAIESESAYNAGIKRQQAGMIEEQKNLRRMQDERQARFVYGKTVAMTAAKGLEMSGSPAAIMVDTMTQMNMDMAITSYNYDMQKYGVMSEAESISRKGSTMAAQYRRGGDTAVRGGWMGGMSALYNTAASVHARNYKFDTSGGAKYGRKV